MENGSAADFKLIKEAVNGNRQSLEEIISKHQNDIYNIALKMVFYPDDALDITQEVLIKIITNLSSFRFESSFKTWAYRITVNTVLNAKKYRAEQKLHADFASYGKAIDSSPDFNAESYSPEMNILVEEVKITCLQAMLICLDRRQRMAFILGSIFMFPDFIASEIMNISKDNFRQLLSRSRKDIRSFMENRCGLVNKSNPCLCSRKTRGMIESGAVNPESLLFNRDYLYNIRKSIGERAKSLDGILEDESERLFRTLPYHETPDFGERIRTLIDSGNFREIFNFN